MVMLFDFLVDEDQTVDFCNELRAMQSVCLYFLSGVLGYKVVDSDVFESNCRYYDLGESKGVKLSLPFTFDLVSVCDVDGFVVDKDRVKNVLKSWSVFDGTFCDVYFDFSNLALDFSGCVAERVSFSLGNLYISLGSTKLLPVCESNDVCLVDVEFCLDLDSSSFVFNFYFNR